MLKPIQVAVSEDDIKTVWLPWCATRDDVEAAVNLVRDVYKKRKPRKK